jgi:hypothetical protein
MKKICYLFIFIISFGKGFSQDCISLGCASNYGTLTADGTLQDLSGNLLGGACYGGGATYKQVFWQFFYSPGGGNFTQTYTPVIDGGGQLDLDYIVYDMGMTAPSAIPCPIDPTPWTIVICNNFGGFDAPTGPGVAGSGGNVLTTTLGHYYALAVILWQGTSNGGDASYSFTISTPQLGGIDLTSANCPGVLPVTLSSFNATINNCNVDLDWTAESQSDFKNYEVQYSNDGIQFETIATIDGALKGSNQKYSYQHNNPRQGNIFYRLKMMDKNGKFEYSKIIVLKLNCNRSSLNVYPNPVTNILNINITNLQNDRTVASLFDANGKLMYSGEMVNGTNVIDMAKFAKGVYLLKLKNSVDTQSIKIIK